MPVPNSDDSDFDFNHGEFFVATVKNVTMNEETGFDGPIIILGGEKKYRTKKITYREKDYYDDDESPEYAKEARAKEKARIARLDDENFEYDSDLDSDEDMETGKELDGKSMDFNVALKAISYFGSLPPPILFKSFPSLPLF